MLAVTETPRTTGTTLRLKHNVNSNRDTKDNITTETILIVTETPRTTLRLKHNVNSNRDTEDNITTET